MKHIWPFTKFELALSLASRLPHSFNKHLKVIDLVLTLLKTLVENDWLPEDAKNVNLDTVIDNFGRLNQKR